MQIETGKITRTVDVGLTGPVYIAGWTWVLSSGVVGGSDRGKVRGAMKTGWWLSWLVSPGLRSGLCKPLCRTAAPGHGEPSGGGRPEPPADGDAGVAADLERSVQDGLDTDRKAEAFENLHAELDFEPKSFLAELAEHSEDFEALQRFEAASEGFSAAELCPLLGLYGGELTGCVKPEAATPEYVGRRQMYSERRLVEAERGALEHTVADRTHTRYGLMLEELLGSFDYNQTT